ncbi:MAG: hypothetical protein GJ680_07710 [Alteromonadaceae bacterium]|nr:hypothetical protein [Alteromonadaceae bacterium]
MAKPVRISGGENSPFIHYINNAGRGIGIPTSFREKDHLNNTEIAQRLADRYQYMIRSEFPYYLNYQDWRIILETFNNGSPNLGLDEITQNRIISNIMHYHGLELEEDVYPFFDDIDNGKARDDVDEFQPLWTMQRLRNLTIAGVMGIGELAERFWNHTEFKKAKTIAEHISDITGIHPEICVGITGGSEYWSRFKKTVQQQGQREIQTVFLGKHESFTVINVNDGWDVRILPNPEGMMTRPVDITALNDIQTIEQ